MLNFFFRKPKCNHKKFIPSTIGSFCPDCGREVEIIWHILRCGNCSGKRRSKVIFNKIMPEEKFCTKCGETGYFIESRERIEFFDYEYAVISKKEVISNIEVREKVQVWIEEDFSDTGSGSEQGLIPVLVK